MKTVQEWSQAFDVLWNNISSGRAPGLTEYEKSLFLTQAENAVVKERCSPKTNAVQEGFDDSAVRQSDFSNLITSRMLDSVTALDTTTAFHASGRKRYEYPADVFVILNEEVSIGGKYCTVVPVSNVEYARLMMKPYKYPPKGQVWRLITHEGTDGESVYPTIELIGKFRDDEVVYAMRYLRRPKPIILEDLLGGLSIEGETNAMTCELPKHLHDEVLARAVDIAKLAWAGGTAGQTQASQ